MYYASNQPNPNQKYNTLDDGRKMVCRIFDYGDSVADRYTIALKGYRACDGRTWYPYLASSKYPFHPQGFGQYGESKEFLTGKHLGKRVRFESLPPDVQKFILQQFTD